MFLGDIISSRDMSDSWFVEGSDDEQTEGETNDHVNWTPDAKDILDMFSKLDSQKVLELKWVCPGRRAPSPDGADDAGDGNNDEDMDSEEDNKEEEKKTPEASEFDFDEFGAEPASITPRRTPGSKNTPRSQKKVASMDNVLNKILHEQKEKAAMKEARRGIMSRSPAGSARFRLGMTGSPAGGQRPVPSSSSGTPLRPPLKESPSPYSPSVPPPESKDVQLSGDVVRDKTSAGEPPSGPDMKPND